MHSACIDIFNRMGTCDEVSYLLTHWDAGCVSAFDTFVKSKFPSFFSVICSFSFIVWVGYFVMMGKSTIYILDFAKDVLFIVLLNNKRVPVYAEFVTVLVVMAIALMIASEAFKVYQLFESKRTPKSHWVLRMILSPFQLLPVVAHHLERKLELRQHQLCAISDRTIQQEISLAKTTNELNCNRRMRGEIRSTENVLEHFFQFIISLTVVIGSASDNTLGQNEILDLSSAEIRFSLFSSVVSLFSMVRGQVGLISAKKNGHLGILAKCVLTLYMAISILVRAGIILMSISASINFIRATYFAELWGKTLTDVTMVFKDTSHLLFVLIIYALTIFHLIISNLIQRRFLKGTRNNLQHALWSLLSPPLFLDWDSHHIMQEDDEGHIPECWRRTKNCFLFHNFLALGGNLALGIPMYIFRSQPQIDIYFQHSLEHEYYKCFGYCGWHLGWFLLAVLAAVIVSQVVIFSLGILYFRTLHPKERILNQELSRENNNTSCWIPQFCHIRWFRQLDFLGVRSA